ncbi:MAG: helix-turn-helix domain-containing protein [Treponema sp.]|jgi:AraC family transcriptional regulator|nr:helix-turn-helix domain-containing protein [Treponema sp.]
MRPYDLLENVLTEIEKRIKEDFNADILAELFSLSSVHLQRLFKFAFKQTLGSYIRSRKLAASLEDLIKTDFNVVDIALEYGFQYEQSYIRTFKREFGLTPGDLRKTGKIIKITPPIHLFDTNKLTEGVIFGPDIVIVPQFHVIGKRQKIPFRDALTLAPTAAKQFWENDMPSVKNIVNPSVYIGLTRLAGEEADYSWYLPSIQVKSLRNIPQGLYGDTFDSSLCVKFRYIGQHHYYDINQDRAKGMYDAIGRFINNESEKYNWPLCSVYFERVDENAYDGTFCQMEWFTPISEKIEK